MREQIIITGMTAQEKVQMEKPRYNAYAYGHGIIADKRSKLKNRNSKSSKRARYEERKEYCCA